MFPEDTAIVINETAIIQTRKPSSGVNATNGKSQMYLANFRYFRALPVHLLKMKSYHSYLYLGA